MTKAICFVLCAAVALTCSNVQADDASDHLDQLVTSIASSKTGAVARTRMTLIVCDQSDLSGSLVQPEIDALVEDLKAGTVVPSSGDTGDFIQALSQTMATSYALGLKTGASTSRLPAVCGAAVRSAKKLLESRGG